MRGLSPKDESTMLPADVMEGRPVPLWDNVETLFGNCVASLYAGAGFGEKALRYDERRGATAVTREDTVVLCVDRNTMKTLEAQAAEEDARVRRPPSLALVLAPENRQRDVLQVASLSHTHSHTHTLAHPPDVGKQANEFFCV
jgi:hypothetical protein